MEFLIMQITRGKVQKAQKIVIYGPEGIGKTTFASQFPDPLFIDTEGGTNAYDVARVDPSPNSWQMLTSYIDDVIREKPCKTLVVDTADWAEILCVEQLCAKYKWTSLDSPGYGEGYTVLKEEFGRFLNRLSDVVETGINVVITAHAMTRKFEQPNEAQPYDRWELKLQKKTAAIVKEWADALLFANYKTIIEAVDVGMGQVKGKARGNKRVMYVSHDACWDAKNRWGLDGEQKFNYSVIAPFITNLTASTPAEPTQPAVIEQSQQQPKAAPVAQTSTSANTETNLPSFWEPALQLMAKDGVTVDEVREVAAQVGHFTLDTPPEKFTPEYIPGFIVPNWPEVLNRIQANRINKEPVPFNEKQTERKIKKWLKTQISEKPSIGKANLTRPMNLFC